MDMDIKQQNLENMRYFGLNKVLYMVKNPILSCKVRKTIIKYQNVYVSKCE